LIYIHGIHLLCDIRWKFYHPGLAMFTQHRRHI